MTSPLLDVRQMTVSYGGVLANADVDLHVRKGQFVGLIGPNGAGKSTFIDAVSGFVRPTAGTIALKGEAIDGLSASRRARTGMSRTFQSLELFDDLPVIENLLIAAEEPRWWTLFLDMVRPRPHEAGLAAAEWALQRVGLSHLGHKLPQDLSHGQRKLVGVARALAARPDLLLLDEPAAGLDPGEVEVFSRQLRSLIEDDLSILLVDHNMGLVLNTCDYIYVLDFGRVLAQGTPAEIRSNPDVIAAYLGGSKSDATTIDADVQENLS